MSNRPFTQDQFLEVCKKIHNNKYDYSKVQYNGIWSYIEIICPTHGEFTQRAVQHRRGFECKKCRFDKMRTSQEDFIKRVVEIHGEKYDLSEIEYVIHSQKVKLTCPLHGSFNIRPQILLSGAGCRECGVQKLRKTTEQFVKKATKIHQGLYDYSKVDYHDTYTKVEIICKYHGSFIQEPKAHISKKAGCPRCTAMWSWRSIEWMTYIEQTENIKIQHAANHGEYMVPELNIQVDGFCNETQTVYEFHGDFWHGNPSKHNPNDINNTIHKTFGELYNLTIDRDNSIKQAGYNLVVIWENDWNIFKKDITVPNVRLLYKDEIDKNNFDRWTTNERKALKHEIYKTALDLLMSLKYLPYNEDINLYNKLTSDKNNHTFRIAYKKYYSIYIKCMESNTDPTELFDMVVKY